MCKIGGASFRLGTVLAARSTSDGDNGGDEIRLATLNSAQTVARGILDRGSAYNEAVRQIAREILINCEEFSDLAIENVAYERELAASADAATKKDGRRRGLGPHNDYGIKIKYDPGLILDFPKLLLTGPSGDYALRTCMTVCIGHMNSKVWTRFVTDTRRKLREMGVDDLRLFHAAAEAVTQACNARLSELYRSDLSIGFGKEVRLKGKKDIVLFAADGNDEAISAEIERKYSELTWLDSGDLEVATPELASALSDLTEIAMPDAAQDQTPEEKATFTLADGSWLFPYKASIAAESIFVVHDDGATEYRAGMVDSNQYEKARENDRKRRKKAEEEGEYFASPEVDLFSIGTTAEIAKEIGSRY